MADEERSNGSAKDRSGYESVHTDAREQRRVESLSSLPPEGVARRGGLDQPEQLARDTATLSLNGSLAKPPALLSGGIPADVLSTGRRSADSPSAQEVDRAMSPQGGSGASSGSGVHGSVPTGSVGGSAGAPVAAPPRPAAASGGGGGSVTMSDDVPQAQAAPVGEEGGPAGPIAAQPDPTTEVAASDLMLMTMACGCGCGCGGGCSCGCGGGGGCGCGCANTAPYLVGNQCGTGCTRAEVFLDYYDSSQGDDSAEIDLAYYFVDDQQTSSSLTYSVDSNSNSSTVSASVSGQYLNLTAIDSPGVSTVEILATDGGSLSSTWSIKVYSAEVTGYVIEERAWGENGFDSPEDSGSDWNVLWTSDSHRWKPEVLPAAAADHITGHIWNDESDTFATAATWCGADPNRHPWAYGTPTSLGETDIFPTVGFGAADPYALLSISGSFGLKPNAATSDASRVSVHAIDSLTWETVGHAHTETVSAQDVHLAELTAPSTERPYWAAHPTTAGTVSYDVVRARATITPKIPSGMTGDLHLAWYDPANTIANVPSPPPSGTTANAVRDNQASLSPVSSKTLEYAADESEMVGYYKVNNPRFGDNFIIAAHPHDLYETEYEFGQACGCGGEVLRFEDYPTACDLINPGRPDFNAPLEEYILDANYQTPVLNILPSVDIDTDSDNDGIVEPGDESEDAMEDDDDNGYGKRIFRNSDDDNENGRLDYQDLHRKDYVDQNAEDNDFAEIQLRLTGGDVDELDGHELWLGHPLGLELYSSPDKERLVQDPNDPSDDGTRSYEIPSEVATSGGGTIYKWPLSAASNLPPKIYAEGLGLGTHDVFWRVVNPANGQILARDTINIKVEKIVWPFSSQQYPDWNTRPTTDWDGLDLGNAWYIDKALVDYINAPGNLGTIETVHPNLDNPTLAGAQLTWSSSEGSPSTTTESYPNGFVMEVDYLFERSRGDGTYGYVKIDPEEDGIPRTKLSFVGNSGVKFGNASETGKPVEAQIIDVWAMVENAGGLDAFNPAQGGEVDGIGNVDTILPFEDEFVNTLMTAIRYEGDFTKMLEDNPVLPDSPDIDEEFYNTLKNNYNRHASNNQMKIEVTRLNPQQTTYMLEIYQGLVTPIYSEEVTLAEAIGPLDLQSHWGSGVIFCDMNIVAK